MPADLLKAHQRLGKAVDALFGHGSFDEIKRLAVLLARYEKLIRRCQLSAYPGRVM